MIDNRLKRAMSDPILEGHIRNKSVYAMDGKPDRWALVYYPIFGPWSGPDYEEPRALMQNLDKPGFWHKEVPLRYLKKI